MALYGTEDCATEPITNRMTPTHKMTCFYLSFMVRSQLILKSNIYFVEDFYLFFIYLFIYFYKLTLKLMQ